MNWTGGRLQLHSKTTCDRSSKAQKQRLSRTKLASNRNKTQSSSLLPPTTPFRSSKPQENTGLNLLQSANSAGFDPFEIPDVELDHASTKLNNNRYEDFREGDSFDQIRRKLLKKRDWLSLFASRPNALFLPTPKTERIGRRRRLNQHQHSKNFNRWPFKNRLQGSTWGEKQLASLPPQSGIVRTRAETDSEARLLDGRILSDLRSLPLDLVPTRSSRDSMLLRTSDICSDEAVGLESKLDGIVTARYDSIDTGTVREGFTSFHSSLVPLSQVKELETFDAVKEHSMRQPSGSDLKEKQRIVGSDDSKLLGPNDESSARIWTTGISLSERDDQISLGSTGLGEEVYKSHFTIDQQAQAEYNIWKESPHGSVLPTLTPGIVKADDVRDQEHRWKEYLPRKAANPNLEDFRTILMEHPSEECTNSTEFDVNNKILYPDDPYHHLKQSSEVAQNQHPTTPRILFRGKVADERGDADAQFLNSEIDSKITQVGDRNESGHASVISSSAGLSVVTQKEVRNEEMKRSDNLGLDYAEIQNAFRFGIAAPKSGKAVSDVNIESGLDQAFLPGHVNQPSLVEKGQHLDTSTSNIRDRGIKRRAGAAFPQHALSITPELVRKVLRTPMLAFTPSASRDSICRSHTSTSYLPVNSIQRQGLPAKVFQSTKRNAVFDFKEPCNVNRFPARKEALPSLSNFQAFRSLGQDSQSLRQKFPLSPKERQMEGKAEDDWRNVSQDFARGGRNSSPGFAFAKDDGQDRQKEFLQFSDDTFVSTPSFAFARSSSLSS